MRIPKFGVSAHKINVEFITIMYCLCIISSTFIRWMNYFNFAASFAIVMYILRTGKIGKSKLCIYWSIFIIVYPLCDAWLRGEVGLSLFTALCYFTPLLMLLSYVNVDGLKIIFINFVKGFAWFQAFGIFLDLIWKRLHIIIAWRLLGNWSYNVTGFSTDATFTAYIICFGVGLYFIEYWLSDNKRSKYAVMKLICGSVLFVALVMTNKRSFLIAVVFAILLIFILQSTVSRSKFFRTIIGCAVVVCLGFFVCIGAYYMGSTNALGRVGATLIGLSEGEDVTSMRSTWAAYMNEWRQGRELFGIGWESFMNRISYTSYADKVPNGHNVYRQILCEEGYVGLSVFVLLLVNTIVIAIKNLLFFVRRKDIDFLCIAMFSLFIALVFAIYSYSGNAIYDAVVYLYFFAAIQLIAILQRVRKSYKL